MRTAEETGDAEFVQGAPIGIEAIAPRFPVDGKGWYHYPGSLNHYPSSGWGGIDGVGGGADDTYALDLNLSGDADNGKPVYAVEAGTVKQVGSSGWVLIEHNGSVTWKARTYNKWYSGYLHMKNVKVKVGEAVTKGKQIGNVSNNGTQDAHLHHALYVGDFKADAPYPDAFLESFDPGQVAGSAYAGFTYGNNIYNEYVDDKESSGSFKFERVGTSADWFETTAYGFYGHMWYTKGKTGADDNIAKWSFNDGVPVTASDWRIYVFVPRNYATIPNAAYKIYRDGVFYTTKPISQLNYRDRWVSLGNLTFNDKQKIRIELGDGNSDSSKWVASDIVKRFRKIDVKLTQK
jgi:hypothetical protein